MQQHEIILAACFQFHTDTPSTEKKTSVSTAVRLGNRGLCRSHTFQASDAQSLNSTTDIFCLVLVSIAAGTSFTNSWQISTRVLLISCSNNVLCPTYYVSQLCRQSTSTRNEKKTGANRSLLFLGYLDISIGWDWLDGISDILICCFVLLGYDSYLIR